MHERLHVKTTFKTFFICQFQLGNQGTDEGIEMQSDWSSVRSVTDSDRGDREVSIVEKLQDVFSNHCILLAQAQRLPTERQNNVSVHIFQR